MYAPLPLYMILHGLPGLHHNCQKCVYGRVSAQNSGWTYDACLSQIHAGVSCSSLLLRNAFWVSRRGEGCLLFLTLICCQNSQWAPCCCFWHWLKWFCEAGGAHLTKPGWSKPHIHSNPINLALFRRKIALYRSIRGLILLQGGSNGSRGLSPPSPPHFNHWLLSRRIQLPSKLSWPDVRLFACHDPPPPLAWYSTSRSADHCARQDKPIKIILSRVAARCKCARLAGLPVAETRSQAAYRLFGFWHADIEDYRPEVESVDASNRQPPYQASLATTGWKSSIIRRTAAQRMYKLYTNTRKVKK